MTNPHEDKAPTDKPADKTAAAEKAAAKSTTPSKAPVVDADSLSAPDQLEVQQLQNARAEAVSRGDDQAVKDIDARLKLFKAEKK